MTLHPTRCAICGTGEGASEIYPANYDPASFSPSIFSARRMPDRIHYRIVRCNACGLVRSDPVAEPSLIAELYKRSRFDYSQEVALLQRTYGGYLRKLKLTHLGSRSLLEIGCGNGFFLEQAQREGFGEVRGIEPSEDAVARAASSVRSGIVCDVVRPGLFADEQFDVIAMFQVLDHLTQPAYVLELCRRMLKPGGLLLALNHNVRGWSARVLGERCPIIDIEHTYLYSPETMRQLFERCGFRTDQTGTAYNTYSLSYIMHLAPLTRTIKLPLLNVLQKSAVGRIPLRVPLGNLYFVGRKA